MKSVYLKAPFLKQLKLRQSKYCVQVYDDYQKNEKILLCDARDKVPATINSVRGYKLSSLPFFVLDDLGFQSRESFEGLLKQMHKGKEIDFVYVLELVI